MKGGLEMKVPLVRASPPANGSTGLGSSGCESGSSTNGETSDYQRSTPSPRDDDIIFQDESDTESEDDLPPKAAQVTPAKDLGFVDSKAPKIHQVNLQTRLIKKAPLPVRSPQSVLSPAVTPKMGFSTKSFYKTQPQVLQLTHQLASGARVNLLNAKPILIVPQHQQGNFHQPQLLAQRQPSRCDLMPASPVKLVPQQVKLVSSPVKLPQVPVSLPQIPHPPQKVNLQEQKEQKQRQQLLQDMTIKQQLLKFKKAKTSKKSPTKTSSSNSTKQFKLKKVEVKLKKLPSEVVGKVQSKKRRPSSDPASLSSLPPTKTAKLGIQQKTASQTLIRPAVLNVKATAEELTSLSKPTLLSTHINKPKPNNPFLPPAKTSFLFGNSDDFETADFNDDEAVLEIDEDTPDELDDKSPTEEDRKSEFLFQNKVVKPSTPPVSPKKIEVSISSEHSALPILSDKSIKKEPPTNTQLRFPTVQGSTNLIECKWKGCDGRFTTYGRLSDHLKVSLL